MRVVTIGGEPGSGKTTIVKQIMREAGNWKTFKSGLCRGHINDENELIVFGLYDPMDVFSGTDKLSMAAQRDCIETIRNLAEHVTYSAYTVLCEGDRLFNNSFINEIRSRYHIELTVVVIEAEAETLANRRTERGSDQSQSWLNGRKTKVENVRDTQPSVVLIRNETEADLAKAVKAIWLIASEPKLRNGSANDSSRWALEDTARGGLPPHLRGRQNPAASRPAWVAGTTDASSSEWSASTATTGNLYVYSDEYSDDEDEVDETWD